MARFFQRRPIVARGFLAVTAMFIAVFGGGFCATAVVIGADRIHALAASAFFTRTSAYDALVI